MTVDTHSLKPIVLSGFLEDILLMCWASLAISFSVLEMEGETTRLNWRSRALESRPSVPYAGRH
eukprot:2310186-Lingulodinium_polyedra.AAC.1